MHTIFAAPHTGKGFMGYAALGFFGALAALLVGSTFPSLIPKSAQAVRL